MAEPAKLSLPGRVPTAGALDRPQQRFIDVIGIGSLIGALSTAGTGASSSPGQGAPAAHAAQETASRLGPPPSNVAAQVAANRAVLPPTPSPTPVPGGGAGGLRIPLPGGLSVDANTLLQAIAALIGNWPQRVPRQGGPPPAPAPAPPRPPSPPPYTIPLGPNVPVGGPTYTTGGNPVPYVPTSPASILGGLTDLVTAGAPIVTALLNKGGNGSAMPVSYNPGGMPVQTTGGNGGGAWGAIQDYIPNIPFFDVAPEGTGQIAGAFVTLPYRPGGASGPRAQDFAIRNPISGRLQFWRYAGVPKLYSRDAAICRTVEKTARKLGGRRRGGR